MLPLRVAADGTPVPRKVLQEEFQFVFFEISLHLREFRERYRVRKQTMCPKIHTRSLRGSFGHGPSALAPALGGGGP